jgi:hypothetical protein
MPPQFPDSDNIFSSYSWTVAVRHLNLNSLKSAGNLFMKLPCCPTPQVNSAGRQGKKSVFSGQIYP